MRIKKLLLKQTARAGALLAAAALMLGFSPAAHAAAGNNNIKIIAWYGAGSLSTSEYARDTIILFNPTQAAITMHNWSIQTGGASGSFTQVNYKLPTDIVIPAGGFYAIAGSGDAVGPTNCTGGAHCNNNYPFDYMVRTIEGDAAPNSNFLSSGAVTVALLDNQIPLGTCDLTNSHLVDIVGISAADGSAPNSCYAGGGAAPVKPKTVAAPAFISKMHNVDYAYATIRRNRCVDTFDNSNDFTLGYIDYENSASTPQPCPSGDQTSVSAVVATPNNPLKSQPFLITADVKPATGATITSVVADLSNIGGSATAQMYDDGTHGDAVAGDGSYSLGGVTASAGTGTSGRVLGMMVTATDSTGNTVVAPIAFTVSPSATNMLNVPGPGNNNIRMIAWYGAGNLANSEYSRDTIILFNPTDRNITANTWSIQSGGATGKFSSVSYKLFSNAYANYTFPPGGFYAITGSGPAYISGVGCQSDHCNLNYPFDYQIYTIEGSAATNQNTLSSTAVTMALVNSQAAVSGTNTCAKESASILDLVGIGSVTGSSPVTCYAGSGYAPYVPNHWPDADGPTTNIHGITYAYATVRGNKCVNTWDNSKDWILGYIDYKNSGNAPQPCASAAVAGGINSQLRVVPTATPNTAHALDTVVFSAKVYPSTGATTSSVVIDLSNLGGSTSTALYDDGSAAHGDATAGDGIYSVKFIPTSAPYFGQSVALNVTATDSAGQTATVPTSFNLDGGTLSITSASGTTATVKAGDVAYFDLTVHSIGGYFGTVALSCTGDPRPEGKDTPIKTNCLMTPPSVTLVSGGTGKTKLAIGTGTTVDAGLISHSVPLALIGVLSMMLIAVAIWRRKHLPLAGLLAVICFLSLQSTGCETSAGLGGTYAAPGTYTFTVHGNDNNTFSIATDLTFTITVQ